MAAGRCATWRGSEIHDACLPMRKLRETLDQSDAADLLLIVALIAAGLVVLGLASRFPVAKRRIAGRRSPRRRGAVEESVRAPSPAAAFVPPGSDPARRPVWRCRSLSSAVGGGLVLAVLAYLIRANPQLRSLDNGVARWGDDHASALSTHGLNVVTNLGSWWVARRLRSP